MTLERPKLKFSHCCYCDAWGEATFDEHPMLRRIRDIENEGRPVTMIWEDCKVCVDHGAPENTKVIIECEMNEAL